MEVILSKKKYIDMLMCYELTDAARKGDTLSDFGLGIDIAV